MEMQKIAEEQVLRGADIYGKRYGADNAALVAKNPKTGEVLALAGSKSFYAEASPAGCNVGVNCKFEPQVNVATTLQSFGSTLKPMIYYEQIKNGVITPKTVIADVPINMDGYKPKNYEGGFVGYKSISYMLQQSRNIPAILLLQHFGVQNFLDDMKKWGYTTLDDPRGYGPSVAVGGADITLLEHMQGFGVLANNGSLVKNAYVLRIEDKDGNVIYEYKPEPVQVGDARAAYIVNQILNGKRGGPGVSFDGRDIAGKTGTSESQTETLFVTYTPEIVVVGWLGNNNNARMRGGTSGFNSARPWISEFVTRIGNRVPATPFERPEGVVVTKNGDMVILGVSDTNFLQRKQVYKNYIMWQDKYFKDKEDADKPTD
jgi:membrane peptidoglycan carboxypeptidase